MTHKGWRVVKPQHNQSAATLCSVWSGIVLFANYPFRVNRLYKGESISNQPNLFPVEILLFFFDVIAL